MGNNEDPQSLHKYTYANCDPVNGSDPTGLSNFTLIGQCVVAGIITGLVTALIVGIDSALGGKDTGQIIFDAGTGFLIGFSIGALLTLVGPLAFASIAPYVPYLLLLLGGWGAYDSFATGHIAQAVFRIIVTVVSVGLANATVRAKAFQFARFLWGKVFPPSAGSPATLLPKLIGNTSPTESILKAVYNSETKEIAVQFPLTEGTHAEIAENAGWANRASKLIGGYLRFAATKVVSGDWHEASGLLPGTAELEAEAESATSLIKAGQH